jgi:hypothetical protein
VKKAEKENLNHCKKYIFENDSSIAELPDYIRKRHRR